ncbi:MAG: NF038122 family metalloprotease [Pseudomonadota bacterium]
MSKSKLLVASAALVALPLATVPANALTIVLNNLGGVEEGTGAFNAFSAAARFWESVFTNDATINLDVGFSQLDPGVLGGASSNRDLIAVGEYTNRLAATGTTALDAVAVLPNTTPSAIIPGDSVGAILSRPGANPGEFTREIDNDGGVNNSVLALNSAVSKALGDFAVDVNGSALDANRTDGTVQFSTEFAFDFNPTDGIDAGAFDFVGIAIHEIGHALGFVTGVDTYDFFDADPFLDDFVIFSGLDLFRYSQESAAAGVLDWAFGGHEDPNTASYFSIDGGVTNFGGDAFFSTGDFNGDGRQASHWRDVGFGEEQRGIMDPTFGRNQEGIITNLDLAAFDAFGWNVNYDVLANPGQIFRTRDLNVSAVPEPASWAMMIGGFGLIGGAMRRRRKMTTKVSYA